MVRLKDSEVSMSRQNPAPSAEKSRRVKAFQQHAHYVLTEAEREHLYKALKDYQKLRNVERLVQNLKLLLNTTEKKDLILKVRQLIPASHLEEFDQCVKKSRLASINPGALSYRSSETVNGSGISRPSRSPRTRRNGPRKPPRRNGRLHVVSGKQEDVADIRVITINKSNDENLGFSVRGGSEHGLGIYVSEVDEDSVADFSGLNPGDQILDVNGIVLEGYLSSSAVKLLTDNNLLKLLVKRTGKIPGWRYSTEHIAWYDTERKQLVTGNIDEYESAQATLGTFLNGMSERRVNLTFKKRKGQKSGLGFNIRGGTEFGLGIYVSRMDKSGLAEMKGVKVGDQILAVNGTSFEKMTHSGAVEFLTAQSQLVLTVRYTGRFPVFKEMYAEYQWLNGQKELRSRPLSRVTSQADFPVQRLARLPKESKIEVYTQTDDEDSSQLSLDIHTEEVLPLQTEIGLPRNSQFILRDNLQQLNSSGSDLEDLILEDFENSFQEITMATTSSEFAETIQDRNASVSSRKSRSKANSLSRKPGRKQEDTMSSYSGSVRIRGVFEKSFGSQIMHRRSIGGSNMMTLENRARSLLPQDEASAVIRHIHTYKETKDIERLVQVLLVILDRPEKVLLLRDIRGVILPTDIGRFDSMVSRYEMQASSELQGSSPKASPVRHVKDKPLRTRMLMDPVTDLRGSFHLEEHDHLTNKYRTDEVKQRHREMNDYSSDPEVVTSSPKPRNKITTSTNLHIQSAITKENESASMAQSSTSNALPSTSDAQKFSSKTYQSPSKAQPSTSRDQSPSPAQLYTSRDQSPSKAQTYMSRDQSPSKTHSSSMPTPPPPIIYGQSDVIFVQTDTHAKSSRSQRSRHSSWNDDNISLNSLGSSVSSVDSTPVAFDDLDLPPSWSRSHHGNKVEMRSYALVKDGRNSVKSPTPGNSVRSSPSKSPERRNTATPTKRTPSQGSSVKSESHRHLNFERTRSPVRYVTSMKRTDSPHRSLTTPPPPLLIASFPSSVPPPAIQLSPLSPPVMFKDHSATSTIVKLSKAVGTLGLSISGGKESKSQPEVKVEKIFPGGSAAQEGTLQAGMLILSVDGESLNSVTHSGAVDVIRRAWNNKHKSTMDVEVDFTV